MIEMSPLRKNKISLSDYDYHSDIENRLLMAQFSTFDLEVLEEILYSSLTISIRKLAKSLDVDETELLPVLEKLSKSRLFTIQGDALVVDKEVRKYYEAQALKFDEEFRPGMEYLQGLLRKVPIHVLPIWYSIPRTSNNIFDSIVEKYLFTPQIYQRYLLELSFGDPVLSGIVHDVHHSPDYKMTSRELIEKYGLSREQFEEYMLHLEFSFACCLGYNKVGDQWKEVVTPFHEWREYLNFLKDTATVPIKDTTNIVRKRLNDFAFVQDMGVILGHAKKQPIPLTEAHGKTMPQKTALNAIVSKCATLPQEEPFLSDYIQHLISKLCLLKLADVVDGKLYALEAANDWLDMSDENRALFLYRHPLNRLLSDTFPAHLISERNTREAEKSVVRVLNSGWVFFDDFIKGVMVPLSEDSIVMLKRSGKSWRYSIPQYTDEEKALIKAVILEWLFEVGAVAVGTKDGRDCFCVTSLGQALFGR